MASAQEDKKPNVNDLEDGEFINIRVMQQDGAELQFKIKRKTPMRKLMDAWFKKRGIERRNVRFHVDGANINDDDTPTSLEMEDHDCIDAAIAQVGGWMYM